MAHQKRSPVLTFGAVPLLAAAAAFVVGASSVSAAGTVSTVTGSAFGLETANLTLFTGPQNNVQPTPSVSLTANASNSPQSASVATGLVQFGPATLFTSDDMVVSTKGSLGASCSVTSSSDVKDINRAKSQSSTGSEELSAADIASTCTAAPSGTTAGVTVTNGTVATLSGNSDPNPPTVVNVPASPAPNTTISGKIDLGSTDTESFHFVFNEQSASGGTVTVNAVHEYLEGPTAKGDVIIGQVVCGTNATVASVSANSGTGSHSGVAGASTTPGTPAAGSGHGLNEGALIAIAAGAAVVVGSATTAVVRRRSRARADRDSS
jgi:hypothetical protein